MDVDCRVGRSMFSRWRWKQQSVFVALRRSKVALLFMALVAWWVGLAGSLPAEEHADQDMVDFLVAGYRENREKFDAFVCRYHVIEGIADSLDDAIEGRYERTIVRNGYWAVDGESQVYVLLCEDREQAALPKIPADADPSQPIFVAGVCADDVSMTNKQLGLTSTTGLGAASISPSIGKQPRISNTPISMGIMGQTEELSPAGPLDAIPRKIRKRHYRASVAFRGRTYDELSVGTGEGDAFVGDRWYFQSTNTFLPMACEYSVRGLVRGRAVVTDYRRLANGGDFPFRSVYQMLGNADGRYRVTIFEVDEMTLGKPTREQMTLQFPAETQYVDNETWKSFVAAESIAVHPDQLDQLYRRIHTDAAPTNTEPPLASIEKRQYGWILLVAIIAAIIPWFLMRRPKRATPPQAELPQRGR